MDMRQSSRAELNGETCPVPLDVLGTLLRSTNVVAIIADIPERSRARLAVYLYGRSHTHALGLQVAAATPVEDLHAVAGRLGREIHALATTRPVQAAQREGRLFAKPRISLGGGSRS